MSVERKRGFVLRFHRGKAVVVEDVQVDEDEKLEGKMYLFADSVEQSLNWRRALRSYAHNNLDSQSEDNHGVDVRFLW